MSNIIERYIDIYDDKYKNDELINKVKKYPFIEPIPQFDYCFIDSMEDLKDYVFCLDDLKSSRLCKVTIDMDEKKLIKMEDINVAKFKMELHDRVYREQFMNVEDDEILTKFKKGQVWENPDGLLMMVTDVKLEIDNPDIDKAKVGELKISYISEDGEKGFFYLNDRAIEDNIKIFEV